MFRADADSDAASLKSWRLPSEFQKPPETRRAGAISNYNAPYYPRSYCFVNRFDHTPRQKIPIFPEIWPKTPLQWVTVCSDAVDR